MLKIAAFVTVLAVPPLWAQMAISARSGMIHYVEGRVTLDGDAVRVSNAQFPEVRDGRTLETGEGRAEVLLNPGVFLRLDRNSSFKMLSSRLTDTHIEILRGSALLEVEELAKDNRVTVHLGESTIQPVKRGLYHFDGEAREMRVYDGKALAALDATPQKITRGRSVTVAANLEISKFDRKKKDDLYAWSSNRSSLIATANHDVSWTAVQRGNRRRGVSAWAWSPRLGMYTFLPGSGRIYSPFGWYWYSPAAVWALYTAPRINPNTGWDAASSPSWGSRPAVSYPSSSAASAAASGDIGRGSGGGGEAGGGAVVSNPGGGRDR
jgi:hypothetical protein